MKIIAYYFGTFDCQTIPHRNQSNKNSQAFPSLFYCFNLMLIPILVLGCSKTENKESEMEKLLKKEKMGIKAFQSYKNKLLLEYGAIDLDNLFKEDSSILTYSYKTEDKLSQIHKPILAKGIISDIIRVNDTLFVIHCMIVYKKAITKTAFYGELKASQKLITKIENLKINPTAMVLLTLNFSELKSLDFEIKDKEDYEINFNYFIEQSYMHRIKGFCLDVDYNSEFSKLNNY